MSNTVDLARGPTRTRSPRRAPVALAALATVVTLGALGALGPIGCVADQGRGQRGRVHLRFASDNIFISPYDFRPLMLGTHEGVLLQETRDVPALTAVSTNTAVFTVTSVDLHRECCLRGSCNTTNTASDEAACYTAGGYVDGRTRIEIATTGLGEADLVLQVGGGVEYDRVTVSVRAPASLRLEPSVSRSSDRASASGITVAAGNSFYVRAVAFDAAGAQLEARYGFRVTNSDDAIATVREPGSHPTPGGGLSAVSFDVNGDALRGGMTTVTFEAGTAGSGSVSASVPVTVR